MNATNARPLTKKIRALSAFYHKGEVIAKGAVADLPTLIAIEMIAYNRAVEVAEDEAPVEKPKRKMKQIEETPDVEQ